MMECEIGDETLLPPAPAVSVLMLAYNHRQFIAQAIDSVVMQVTDFPVEIIIGEDCSIDGTYTIIQEYQRRYPHMIRFVTSANNIGMMQNFLRTLSKIRGKYVAICEGDDLWIDKFKLQKQFDKLEKCPAIAICFHAAWLFEQPSNRIIRRFPLRRRPRQISADRLILMGGGFVPTASIFLRRDTLPPKVDWFINAPIGDYPVIIWAASQGVCFYDPEIMSIYRTGHYGSWNSRSRSEAEEWAYVKDLADMLLGLASDLNAPKAIVAAHEMTSLFITTAVLERERSSIQNMDDIQKYKQYITLPHRIILTLAKCRSLSMQIAYIFFMFKRFKSRLKRALF